MTSKEKLLETLKQEMEKDQSLPLLESNLVFGEGPAKASLMFIGEAPGKKEDETGRPFVGRSGQILDKAISTLGLERKDVYITNIVKRRPPDNRDPLEEEIFLYSRYLKKQIKIIKWQVPISSDTFSSNSTFGI